MTAYDCDENKNPRFPPRLQQVNRRKVAQFADYAMPKLVSNKQRKVTLFLEAAIDYHSRTTYRAAS